MRQRQVFFIPGYDPSAARRYREVYRRQAARQAAISGYEITVSACHGGPDYAWAVEGRMAGQVTRARIDFLAWQDLVRLSMNRSIPASYLALLRTAWIYLRSGALTGLLRLRAAPMLAAFYPVVILLGALVVAGLLCWGGAIWLGNWMGASIGAGVGAALAAVGLVTLRRLDRFVYAFYLAHDYHYGAQHWGRYPADLDARIDDFAQKITTACATADEVLIVGHSSGAQLAVSALARARRGGAGGTGGAALSLLTLGQVIPMISFLPEARALRGDLHALSQDDGITWVDVSAPGDGGCFALSDPVRVTGVAPAPERYRGPKILSAAFSHTMSESWQRRTRFRFLRRHTQYLCAFDHPGDYDYFRITAGPLTLGERFAARGSTASRIETVLSPCSDH